MFPSGLKYMMLPMSVTGTNVVESKTQVEDQKIVTMVDGLASQCSLSQP